MAESSLQSPGKWQAAKSDLLASLVVFLVALPLCMGIAIASGVDPAKGLIAGAIGGIVVGLLAGCPLQVSGPAAGLTVLVFQFVTQYGIANLGWIVLGGGLVQFLAGTFRLGGLFRSVPPSLIAGMLSGIGVIIFASQFHVMVDHIPASSTLGNLLTIPESIQLAMTYSSDLPHFEAALIGMSTLLCILGWNRFRPAALSSVPGPLVGVAAATTIAVLFSFPIRRVEIPANILESLTILSVTDNLQVFDVVFASLTLAIIASAETLLCANSVDQMHDGPPTRYNKELMAQGVGNMVSGLLGCLPITGVIVRSSANIEAGGTTRLSAILHGIWILAFVAFFASLLSYIPMASLAAILVYTGVKLLNIKQVRELSQFGNFEVAIYLVTVGTIVSTDLLTGVAAGFVVSLLVHVYRITRLQVDTDLIGDEKTIVRLSGVGSFLNYHRTIDTLTSIKTRDIEIDVSRLVYMDHAFFSALENWKKRTSLKENGMTLAMKDVNSLRF